MIETVMAIVVIGGLLAALFLFHPQSRRAISITDPSLAFLNLAGDELSHLIDRDRSVLASLFTTVEFGAGYPIPSCDVLFIYANVGVDGSIGLGAGVTIRHLAENAGAVIAVLASDNPAENIVTASRLPGPKKANLIWTLDRKGVAFGGFFKELFTRMYSGQSMPMAWLPFRRSTVAACTMIFLKRFATSKQGK